MNEKDEKKWWDTGTGIGISEIERSPSHPVVEFYSNRRFDYMKKYIDMNLIKTALDVGCGTGYSSVNFPSFIPLIALDFSFRNLEINPIKRKIQASAYRLPFHSNSFDLVYGWDFLHHLEEPEKAMMEMARVTKKYLVMFEPNRNNPVQFIWSFVGKHERGTLKFNKKKLLNFLENVNFKLNSCDYVGWVFAGVFPKFSIKIFKHLPFVHKLGTSTVIICEKL